MIEGTYLTEAILKEKPKFILGRMNLFEAQTGQGKTTAAIQTIPAQLNLNPQRCLILIDSVMGRDEKVAMGLCQQWGEQYTDRPYIMTYAKFGALLSRGQINQQMFDYIACDEIHNLIKYVRIDEATIKKRNPDSPYEAICLLLSYESCNYKAIDAIMRWMKQNIWMFAFTATSDSLSKWRDLKNYIHKIQINEQLIAYQVLQKYEYTDPEVLLMSNPDTKRFIHVPTITLGFNFKHSIENNTGRNVLLLWAKTNERKMDEEQLRNLNYLLTYHVFPPGVDDIITTEAFATGWNLEDLSVEEVIVHNSNKDIQIQFPGRKRGDWKTQWVYNSEKAKIEKRVKRNTKQREQERLSLQNSEWIVPEYFLHRRLGKEDKEQLIKVLNYPKKWTSLKKALEKNYDIRQVGSGAYYGHIIEIKET